MRREAPVVDALIGICVHDPDTFVEPPSVVRNWAAQALAGQIEGAVLSPEAKTAFLMTQGALSFEESEKAAAADLTDQMHEVMAGSGLDPAAYDLRSFTEELRPNLKILCMAAVRKEVPQVAPDEAKSVEATVSPVQVRKQRITPLIEAVQKQDAEAVRSLIQAGDDIEATDSYGQTALHWATKDKSVEIVQLLLEAGADPNAKDEDGDTPLKNAQKNANPAIAQALAQRKGRSATGTGRQEKRAEKAARTDPMNESYQALDNFWGMRPRPDNRMAITFITYLKSKEVLRRALDELSFAQVDGESLRLPEGINIRAQILTDMNRIALVFFVGRFTKSQAREVISTFSKYAYREANEKKLAEVAAEFGLSLQKKGGGGLIWTEWPTEGAMDEKAAVKQERRAVAATAAPPAPAVAPQARTAAPKARPAAKEPPKKRRLPVWAIVLLVLGAATLAAVGLAMVATEPRVVETPATEAVALQPAEEEPTLPTPELTGVAPEPTVQRAEEEAKQVFEISPEPTESISEPTPTPATAAASPDAATATIPTAAPTSAAESTAVLGEWIPVDFMIPNPSLWRDTAEGIYTAVGSEDAFAWSRKAYDGNLMVSLDLKSPDNRASGCVVVYGDGQGFSQGNLIFCVDWDGYGLEKHTIYHEGENYLTFVHDDSVDLKSSVYSVTMEIIDDVASMYVNGERVLSTFFDTEEINRGGRVGLLKKWFDPEITFSNVQIKALGDEDG